MMCVMQEGPDELDTFYPELPVPEGIYSNTWEELTEDAAGQLTRKGKAIPWQILQQISWDGPSAPPFPIHPLPSHHPIPGCGCEISLLPLRTPAGVSGLATQACGGLWPRSCPPRTSQLLISAGNVLWNHGVPLAYVSNGFNTSSLNWLTVGWEGREKPIKRWLSVNVRKKVHQQKQPGTLRDLFIYFLLLSFG